MEQPFELAFVEAYERHADELFRFCLYRVYDRERAKDLLQETFTRVWQYLVAGHEVQNFRAFLYQTARNLIIDASRRRREQSLEQLQEGFGFQPAVDDRDRLVAALELSQVAGVMRQLEAQYREVLVLRYANGLKPKEIAAITGESANVISVRLHRAVRRLKTLLHR